MNELNLHNQQKDADVPILSKFNESYKLWHGYLPHLPRLTRFTLGVRIDNFFTDCLELTLMASYAGIESKLGVIQRLSTKFDALKFFLKLLWEIKALDNNKYAQISLSLNEIGKMIGGWLKLFKNKLPR